MTRYRIHKARSRFFLRKADRLSGISLMCLRYLPQQLHLVITSKSVPTAMEGFHRVRRGLPGRLEAGITLTIGNTPSLVGLYLIGNCHDVRLLQIMDYYRRSRRIIGINRISVWFRIWRSIILVVLRPILIWWYFWEWLKSPSLVSLLTT